VFPGVALGVIASRSSRVTDDMFAAAASALAGLVTEDALASGVLFPPLTSIRDVSVSIAVAVARVAFESGLAAVAPPRDLEEFVRAQVFEPVYPSYV
jgi:malate dehydrogenase (oxaloacetate-decarboxylating)(NADP+)